jgi:ornithine cyclodeaminase/alanine dehydrogenase-like protein (mu-crystallin family)
MLILSAPDVRAALPAEECAAAMREALAAYARGEAFMPLRSVVAPADAEGFLGLMPAWQGEGPSGPASFSLKAVCIMPGNPARGLDAHQGLVILFDGRTGVATAALDGSAVTAIRTAAVSAVATDLLASPQAAVLTILGSGVQAHAHLHALGGVRPFREVRLHSPTAGHAERLIERWRADGASSRVVAVACATGEEAVRGADVVVTATNSRTPVLDRSWLAEGAHVNAIGASQPASLEIGPETFAACAVFADSRESVTAEAGEYQAAVREGLIEGEGHIRAELGEVLAGMAPGRTGEDEITLFRSLGLAVEDLAAAQVAVSRARERGLGTEVEL